MSEWTPGPWKLEVDPDDPECCTAQVLMGLNEHGEVSDQAGWLSIANARLIAAAPEMAELLAEWVDRARVPSIRVERETRALLDRIAGEVDR